MLTARKQFYLLLVNFVCCLLFVVLSFFLIGRQGALFAFSVSACVFFCLTFSAGLVYRYIQENLEQRILYSGATTVLMRFIEQLRSCYSLDDFFELSANLLECEADCAVLYIDRNKNYLLYKSPHRLVGREDTMHRLAQNFPPEWEEGVFFLGEDLGLVSSQSIARGFFLSSLGQHLYIFCRYIKLFDRAVYARLLDEFVRFQRRINTISGLTEIAELSKEWELLAETQRSFLPHRLPDIAHLDIGAYFRPLINVSGDYYTVLPLSKEKTLVLLGDVSGKGLAAALIMGLVVNTIKILDNKEDLALAVRSVDAAIKSMDLQDKYTVLFIGIIDIEKMTIRYINASMSDPIILTRSPQGYHIKPLVSNCSLIGIIDLEHIPVAEKKLFRGDLILMASDGVSEAANAEGVQLGSSDRYLEVLRRSAHKSAQQFVNDIAELVLSYSSGNVRDDITMLAVKLEG